MCNAYVPCKCMAAQTRQKTHDNNTKHECDNNTTRHRYLRTRNTHTHTQYTRSGTQHAVNATEQKSVYPRLSVFPCVYPRESVCLSLCVRLYVRLYVSVCVSVCLSVGVSVCVSVCVSICLSLHRHRQTPTRNGAQNYLCTNRLVHKMFAHRCVTSKTLILHIENAETKNIACSGTCVCAERLVQIFCSAPDR